MASFGEYTALVGKPNFFTEPTCVMLVWATYESAQSAGLVVGLYVKVKTSVLHCTTGDPSNDELVRDRIDTVLLDVTPDTVDVLLSKRRPSGPKFLGAHQAMTALHKSHAKARRLQEPAMDITEKMMQWDVDDPVLRPKILKPDPDTSSSGAKTKRRPTKDHGPPDPIKQGTAKPFPASESAKRSVKPKRLTLARRGAQKLHK